MSVDVERLKSENKFVDELKVERKFAIAYCDGDYGEYLTISLQVDEEPQPFWDWTPEKGFVPAQEEFGLPWSESEARFLAERCIELWRKWRAERLAST